MSLGLGVLIQSMRGSEASAAAVRGAIGKTIRSVTINKGADPERIELRFEDGSGLDLTDEGQSCCESRYVSCDDDLTWLSGQVLRMIELREGPVVEAEYETHEQEFLAVMTDQGEAVFANHNEHNGYYGGFYVVAKEVHAAEVPSG